MPHSLINRRALNSRVKQGIQELPLQVLPLYTQQWLNMAFLILSDLFALILATVLSIQVNFLFDRGFTSTLYWNLWPMLGVFVLVYAMMKLYQGAILSPADELRRISIATTLTYLIFVVSDLLLAGAEGYAKEVFLLAWIFSLLLIPLNRALIRQICAHKKWWGYPAVVLGAGKTGELVVRVLQRQPSLGLKPVAVLDDDPIKHGRTLDGVPIIGEIELAPILAQEFRIPYAIVAMPGVPRTHLLELLDLYGQAFPHFLLIPELFGFSSLWVATRDLGGMLGLEMQRRLLFPRLQLLKRLFDLVFITIMGIPTIPLILLIMLLIKLDSPGPIFFVQKRPGYKGRPFSIYKFRTMYIDAERRLSEMSPHLRREFEMHGKIKDDPRVTRVGLWLRKFSLDELPQLWNVLWGEMSLVGPRAYLMSQLSQVGSYKNIISQALPGMTGIWQVSGRSELTFEERLEMDSYYVKNWSIWLDLYIIARTVWVVLSGKGAY